MNLSTLATQFPLASTSTEGPTHPVTFGWHLPFTFSTSGPLQACIDRHVHASTDVAEVFLFSHRFYREALRVDCKCIIIIKMLRNIMQSTLATLTNSSPNAIGGQTTAKPVPAPMFLKGVCAQEQKRTKESKKKVE